MKDLLYIYNKETFARSEFGEIQTNFNLSLVVDGTKDSAKVEVINFVEEEVEPYSIVKHEATSTWWVVSHDKVERYPNENNTFLYRHNLELLGAIELLNARDLVDSGFNQNKYTIDAFIRRVLDHSNFEFKNKYNSLYPNNKGYELTVVSNAISLNKKVDYVKTFENYTPLSALREFFDAYNCSVKLSFEEANNDDHNLLIANFEIVSKTGNMSKSPISESVFNQTQELKTMDKNSFGTSVVSNAQNVISTKTKTYPMVGGMEFTSNEYNITPATAILKLPSDIYKLNWLKMSSNPKLVIGYSNSDGAAFDTYKEISFSQFDDVGILLAIQDAAKWLNDLGGYVPNVITPAFLQEQNNIVNIMREYGILTFYHEENYDPVAKKFISQHPQHTFDRTVVGDHRRITLNITTKELANNVETANSTMYWERGKREIGGFGIFNSRVSNNQNEISLENSIAPKEVFRYVYNNGAIDVYYKCYIANEVDSGVAKPIKRFSFNYVSFKVNYVPMSDIKIKVDNSGVRRDSQLYNQNGKLTDSVALSKSLLSYSKEIESNTITKYARYYYEYENDNGTISINSIIPSVGDLVSVGNELYVINNVSMTFYQNEAKDYGTCINYYVDCEFTMSKNIATKSLMVNPNTNIRDYGIPQNFNVKRKQLYRDFYELTYVRESNESGWYLPLDKVLNVDYTYSPYREHIAIIKLTYDGAYGGNPKTEWYYQLDSITFVMKKSLYEIIDFKDNNIIGYGSQNVWCGWDIQRVFKNQLDDINIPISYVDEYGEVKGIEMYFSTQDKVGDAWKNYVDDEADEYSSDYNDWERNGIYSVFIPKDIYDNVSAWNMHDFKIEEPNYQKDATEVPVFEYSCQIDDSNDILIGSNILDMNNEDAGYVYLFKLVEKNKYNDNNYNGIQFQQVSFNDNTGIATATNVVVFTYNSYYGEKELLLSLYESVEFNLNTKEITLGNEIDISTLDLDNNDLMVLRHRFYKSELIKYRLTIKAGGNVVVSGRVGGQSVVIQANQTYSVEVEEETEYEFNVTPRDSYFYLEDDAVTIYRGYVNGDVDLGTTASALAYRFITFNMDQGIQFIVVSLDGVGTSYYNPNPPYAFTKEFKLKQGIAYTWSSNKIVGYTITANETGSGNTTDGNNTINISVSRDEHTLSITAGGNSIVQGSYTHDGVTTNVFLSAGQSITKNDMYYGDTYSFTASPRDSTFYFDDGETTSWSGTIHNDNVNIGTTPSAKSYRSLTINWKKGVQLVSFTIGGVNTSYYNPTPGADYGNQVISSTLKQGLAWSYQASPVTNYEITSGGSGSGNTTSGNILISPEAERPQYPFSITAGGNVIVSGTVAGVSIFLSAGQTYSANVEKGSSYSLTVTPRDSYYYIPSGSTTSYSGYVNSTTNLGTTASALAYRTFTIEWNAFVHWVVVGGQSYYNPSPATGGSSTTIKKEQGFGSVAYSSHAVTGHTITSYASGTWYDSGNMTISPTAS